MTIHTAHDLRGDGGHKGNVEKRQNGYGSAVFHECNSE